MNLAVMSDLHIGLAARGKDLCPEPPLTNVNDRKKYETKIENSYRRKFIDFLLRERITANYLILPGDITHKAHLQEVQLASEFILQVADVLSVPRNKIVFAPGNHDVDWSVYDVTDTAGVRWQERYASLAHESAYFRTLINQGSGNLLSSPHFTAWKFDDLFAISYNSASHDSPSTEVHHGLCDPGHLVELRRYLDSIGDIGGHVRVLVVHHHLHNFSDPFPEMPDFSLMTNAENLFSLLHERRFDFIIHGHLHQPRFEALSTQTYPHLPTLCSGSFSVEIDTRYAGTINNQFHLVTIDGRAGNENQIKGKITSWTNNQCRGWVPSEESSSGIDHVIPFGSYVMPGDLDAVLNPFITHWFEEHDHILWKDVVDQFPHLEYLPINSAVAAFKRMGQRLGKQVMYQTLKDLIMY